MRYRMTLAAALLASLAACTDSGAPTAPLNPSYATLASITLAVTCARVAVWALMLDAAPLQLVTTLPQGDIRLAGEPGPHYLQWVELDPATAAALSHGSARADVGRTGPIIPIACAT